MNKVQAMETFGQETGAVFWVWLKKYIVDLFFAK